jgi:hypothetical protein
MGVKFTFTPASTGVSPAGDLVSYDSVDAVFPGSNPAGVVVRDDVSLITFPAAVDQNILYEGTVDNGYNAGLLVVDLFWLAAVAVAGNVVWGVAWARQRNGDAISRPFAPQKTVGSTAQPVNGDIRKATVVFTQAEADAVAPADPYKIRVRRNGADGADTMVDTAQLLRVTVRE